MFKKEWSCLQYILVFVAYSILYWGIGILCSMHIIALVFRILEMLSVDHLFEPSGSAQADLFSVMVLYLLIMLLVYPFLFVFVCRIIKFIAKRRDLTL